MSAAIAVFAAVLFVAFLVFFVIFSRFAFLWMQATASGVRLSFMQLIAMKMRRVDGRLIVRTAVRLASADIRVPVEDLERHYLAGGNLDLVADAMITSKNRGEELSFERAAQTDLARDREQ